MTVTETPEREPAWMDAAKLSSHALAEFSYACRIWLPQITVEADQLKAVEIVNGALRAFSKEAA